MDSRGNQFITGFLTPENGTDRMPRNVSQKSPPLTA